MSDREPRSRNSYHLDDDERFQPRVSSTPNVPPEALINQTRWVTFEAKVNISKEEANLISNSLKSSFGIGKEEAFNEVKVFLQLDGMNVSEMKNKIMEFQLNHNLEQDWKIWPQTYAEIFAEKKFPNAKDLSVNLEWRFLSDVDMKNYIQFFKYWRPGSKRYTELGWFIEVLKDAKWNDQRYTKFFQEFDSIMGKQAKSPEVKNAYKSIEGNPSWYRIGKWMWNWEIEFWDWMAMLAKHPLTFYAVAWWFLFWMFWTNSSFTKTFFRRFLVLAWWIVAWPIVRDASWFGEMIDDLIKKGNELWDDVSESNKRTEHKRKEAYNDWYNLWHNAAEGTRRFIEGIPAWVKEKYNWVQGETDNLNSAFNERLNLLSQENSKNWQPSWDKEIYIEQNRFDTILPILASDKQFSNVKIEDLSSVKDIKSLKEKLDKETINKIFKDVKTEETSKMNEDLFKLKKFIVNFASKNNWQGKKYETVWDVFAGNLTFLWAIQEWLEEGNVYLYKNDVINEEIKKHISAIWDKNKKAQLMRMLSRGPLGNWDISETYSNLKKVNTTGWNSSDKDILNQLISIYWWLELESKVSDKLWIISWTKAEKIILLKNLEETFSKELSKLSEPGKSLFEEKIYDEYFSKELEVLQEEGEPNDKIKIDLIERRQRILGNANKIPELPKDKNIDSYKKYIDENLEKYNNVLWTREYDNTEIYPIITPSTDENNKIINQFVSKQISVKKQFSSFEKNTTELLNHEINSIKGLTEKIEKHDSKTYNKYFENYKKEIIEILQRNCNELVSNDNIDYYILNSTEKWYKFTDMEIKIKEINPEFKLEIGNMWWAFTKLIDVLRNKQEEVSKIESDIKKDNLNRLKDTLIENIPFINETYNKNKDSLIKELTEHNHNWIFSKEIKELWGINWKTTIDKLHDQILNISKKYKEIITIDPNSDLKELIRENWPLIILTNSIKEYKKNFSK